MAWIPRVAASVDSDEGRLKSLPWDEAQAWCNFVLLRPKWLPEHCALGDMVLRPEAPPGRMDGDDAGRSPWTESNRSAHRCEIVGEGRRLRLKQFLYDWGPPAFDHPALWESEVEGFPVRGHVGWLGTDYQGLRGASLHVHRTMAEVAVTEGEFTDDELREFCGGLRPVSADARETINGTPFGSLTYQDRHESGVVRVPTGYWKHHREYAGMPMTILTGRDAPESLPGASVRPPDEYEFRLDTTFVYGDPAAPIEAEFVHQDAQDPGRYIRVLASPAAAEGGVGYPPALDEQPCERREIQVNGNRVHHAYASPQYGPHEAVWHHGGVNVALLVKPAEWTDLAWFEALLESMLPPA